MTAALANQLRRRVQLVEPDAGVINSPTRAVARVGVMQVTDTLNAGGLEKVALNLGNLLPRDRFASFLCATRENGPLSKYVASDVRCVLLHRAHRFDLRAIKQLNAFIRPHNVGILHAHGTSLFIAVAASLLPPHPTVIWHDHFGAARVATRPAWLYRLALRHVAGVIAVNPQLAEWSRGLGVPSNRVWYIPNFACDMSDAAAGDLTLPGHAGARVVCVAKFRPQKDHLTLIRAWAMVQERVPQAHLILVGSGSDIGYLDAVRGEISRCGVAHRVTLLGERSDVSAILRGCDVGVLSSASEGFPLALIEYGMAGLAAVATRVGQCAEVIGEGAAGLLVPPGDPQQLADAVTALLGDTAQRASLGRALHARVSEHYSAERIMRRICDVYDACHSMAEVADV